MTKTIDTQKSAQNQASPVVLAANSVGKQYGPVTALSDVSIDVRTGEIRALVGENGSGKSTLVGIISGTVIQDHGTVTIADRPLTKNQPMESQNAGVLSVFQDGSLLPTLSVAQNLYIGTPSAQRPKYSEIVSWAAARLNEYDLLIDPNTKTFHLSPGDRQILEIVRAVMAKPQLLILDESTSALDASGVDRVIDLMRIAAKQDTAVLFVTHRLSEVFRVADSVTILRDGRFVGTHDASQVVPQQVVELMAGTKVDTEFPVRHPLDPKAPEVLKAEGLGGQKFGPVDLTLRAGEIVGIAGADGNGQGQLIRGLATIGVLEGTVTALGTTLKNYRQAAREGVVFLSGDRKNESLFQSLSIRENLVSGVLGKLSRAGVVGQRAERRFVDKQISDFGIRLGSPNNVPGSLSGGNQQKIAVSKALATGPKVFLIDEPTQGVDVRSRMEVYRFIRACADAGNAVVIVSSDASELAGVADRIVVMSRGRIIESMPGLGSKEETIVGAFAVASQVTEESEAQKKAVRPESASKGKKTDAATGSRRSFVGRIFRNDEVSRLSILALLIICIGAVTAIQNPTFVSALSLRNILIIATPLAAVAIAQYFVLLIAGIDVSVGATMSLSVVLVSFLAQSADVFSSILISILGAVVIGVVVGMINALLVERIKLSPVIATIATLGIVSGVALALRPSPSGAINYAVSTALTSSVGIFPIALLVLVVLVVVGDRLLRQTGVGLRIRAVGINGLFANRLGIRATTIRGVAYVVCAVMAAMAGILLAGQVGIGDASVGNVYTLLAIAAPVIGGASLLGGRGTAIGALLGSILLALLMTLATVLGISQGVNLLFIGGITIIALLTYVLPFKGLNATR